MANNRKKKQDIMKIRVFLFIVVFALMLACFTGYAEKIWAVGDKGEEVKAVEARLIELGYLTGEADAGSDLLAAQRHACFRS